MPKISWPFKVNLWCLKKSKRSIKFRNSVKIQPHF